MPETHPQREVQDAGYLPTPKEWEKMKKLKETRGEWPRIAIWAWKMLIPWLVVSGDAESHQHTFHAGDM
jgi:hypothetical protein